MSNKDLRRLILDELKRRQTRNKSYSLRRFARDLGISASIISNILAGKREMSHRMAERILPSLKLSEADRVVYESRISEARERNPLRQLRRATAFKQIKDVANNGELDCSVSEWYHFAVLYLMQTPNFRSDISWIARRLELTEAEVTDSLQLLEKLKLIHLKDGKYTLNQVNVETSRDIPSEALKTLHEGALRRSLSAVRQVPLELRDITSLTLPFDPERIDLAKKMIEDFSSRMDAFFGGAGKEVYALNIQLIPLTKLD